MAKKLQCKVPEGLGKVITDLQIEAGTKGRALERLVKAALADGNEFEGDGKFGEDDKINCTLTVAETFYKNDTLRYRQRYSLVTATAFFRQALEHGAVLQGQDRD